MSNTSSVEMPLGQRMPTGALPAAICVVIYSFICLLAGILLILTLDRNRQRFTYIYFISFGTSSLTAVSIVQQIFYIVRWRECKLDAYKAAIATATEHYLVLGPQSYGFARITYWIQTYLFSANAMIVLFWAVALTSNAWNWRGRIFDYRNRIGNCSKVLALGLPMIQVIVRANVEERVPIWVGFVVNNLFLLSSFTIGALCVFSILVRYIYTRMKSKSADSLPDYGNAQADFETGHHGSRLGLSKLDPWLMLRFSIAFTVFSGYNIYIILYSIGKSHEVPVDASEAAPDFTVHRAVRDCISYLPPVTSSLMAFLVFGTTTEARRHYENWLCCCRRRQRDLETADPSGIYGSKSPERNPSLDSSANTSGSSLTKVAFRDEYELRSGSLMPFAQLEAIIDPTPKAANRVWNA